MRTSHTRKLVTGCLALTVLGCLWFFLAPVGLGGSTSYVVTEGVSMEPRFHAGDLALVRRQGSYRVGEIVAYRSDVFHTIVLHRITARSGNRYVFKGDNNNFVDFEHPTSSQLLGALWLQVPGAGARLESIRSPLLVGVLIAVATLLFAGAAFTRRRRRRLRERRSGESGSHPSAPQPGAPGGPAAAVLAIGVVAMLPFIALAVLAFSRPTSAPQPVKVPYHQSGTFSYSAAATPGPTYPGNRVLTGDPIFTRVVKSVDLAFGYRFDSAARHSLAGSASLWATLVSTAGWRKTMRLAPAAPFSGDRTSLAATLSVQSLLALVDQVQRTTGVSGSYTLTIVPHVSAAGRLAKAPLRASFSPSLRFSLNQLEIAPILSPAGSAVPARPSADEFTPAQARFVTTRSYQPVMLSLKVGRVSVSAARRIALGGIAIVLCVLLTALAFVRPRPRDEAAAIRARYGRMIVPVERVWQPPDVAVIDVADIEALVRIAERYERSILHEAGETGDAFWVTDESGHFRYVCGSAVWSELPEWELEYEDEALRSAPTATHWIPGMEPAASATDAPPHPSASDSGSESGWEGADWGPRAGFVYSPHPDLD